MAYNMKDAINIGIVKAIAKREASKITGVTIQSIEFDREENNLYYYNVTLTNNTVIVFTIPINTSFTDLYVVLQSSSDENDNGNFRFNVIQEDGTTKLVTERREGGAWVRKATVGSLESDHINIDSLSGSLSYKDSSGNYHIIAKPSVTGQGAVLGEPSGKVALVSNGTVQVVKCVNTQLQDILNGASDVTQNVTTVEYQFKSSRVQAILSIIGELANVPANTKLRATLINMSNDEFAENVSSDQFVDGNGQAVANGLNTINFTRLFAIPLNFDFKLKLQFSAQVTINGSNVDLGDGLGTRFVPKSTINYYQGTETDNTDSGNVVSQIEAKEGDAKLDRNSLKNLPIEVGGYNDETIYRRGDTILSLSNGIEHLFMAVADIQAGQGAPTSIDDFSSPWRCIDIKSGRKLHSTLRRYEYADIVFTVSGEIRTHWMLVVDSVAPNHAVPSDTNSDWIRIPSASAMASLGKKHTGFSSSDGQINPTLVHAGYFFEFTGNISGELNAGVFLPASTSDDDLFDFFTFQNRGTVPQIVRGASVPGHTINFLGNSFPFNIDVGTSVTFEIVQRTANSTTYAVSNIDVTGGSSGTSEGSLVTSATLIRDDDYSASGGNARLNHTYSMEALSADRTFTIGSFADFNLISNRSGFFNVSNPNDDDWVKVVNSNGNFQGMATNTIWLAPREFRRFEMVRSGNDYMLYPIGRVAYKFEAESGLLVPNNWTISPTYDLPSDLIKLREGGSHQLEFGHSGIITNCRVDLVFNFNGTQAQDFGDLDVLTPSINLQKNGSPIYAGHDVSVLNLTGAKVGYHQEFDPVMMAATNYLDVTGTDLTDILGTTVTIRGEYILKPY